MRRLRDEGVCARTRAVAPQVEGLGSCGAVLAAEEGRRRRLVSWARAPAGPLLPPHLEYVASRYP